MGAGGAGGGAAGAMAGTGVAAASPEAADGASAVFPAEPACDELPASLGEDCSVAFGAAASGVSCARAKEAAASIEAVVIEKTFAFMF